MTSDRNGIQMRRLVDDIQQLGGKQHKYKQIKKKQINIEYEMRKNGVYCIRLAKKWLTKFWWIFLETRLDNSRKHETGLTAEQ